MRAIHQIVASMDRGDAISHFALLIQRQLRELGYRSDLFVLHCAPSLIGKVRRVAEHRRLAADRDGLIFHHSIGSEVTDYVARAAARDKLLIYHNITPEEFIAPHSSRLAALLREGRRSLAALADCFPAAVGVSRFNAKDLTAAGYRRVGVLPISVDFDEWDAQTDDSDLARRLEDGRTTIIFVGRTMPHKCPHDLLDLFAYYVGQIEPDARLFAIGGYDARMPGYNSSLISRAREIPGDVHLPGKYPFNKLVTAFRRADLFCSMSEHEGFMATLLEAMHLDVPILAYGIDAVRETLGGAGVVFDGKAIPQVAEMAFEIVHNARLREGLLARQRERVRDFTPEALRNRLSELIEWWTSG